MQSHSFYTLGPDGVTLLELLDARDARAKRQRELLGEFPSPLVLLSITVVSPGPVKRTKEALRAGQAAVEAVRGLYAPVYEEVRDLDTGFEAFIIVAGESEAAVKREMVSLEETHPLGRLFDIDVISRSGAPLSRTSLGLEERKCLVCGAPARICMRLGRHGQEELMDAIRSIVSST